MYTSNDLRIDVVFLESHPLLFPSPILPLPTMEKVEEGERGSESAGNLPRKHFLLLLLAEDPIRSVTGSTLFSIRENGEIRRFSEMAF